MKSHGSLKLADRPILVKCSVINRTFIGFEEASSYWSVHFAMLFISHHQSADLV